jgi:hypothetical protein
LVGAHTLIQEFFVHLIRAHISIQESLVDNKYYSKVLLKEGELTNNPNTVQRKIIVYHNILEPVLHWLSMKKNHLVEISIATYLHA